MPKILVIQKSVAYLCERFVIDFHEPVYIAHPVRLYKSRMVGMRIIGIIIMLRIEFHGKSVVKFILGADLAQRLKAEHAGYRGQPGGGLEKFVFFWRALRAVQVKYHGMPYHELGLWMNIAGNCRNT